MKRQGDGGGAGNNNNNINENKNSLSSYKLVHGRLLNLIFHSFKRETREALANGLFIRRLSKCVCVCVCTTFTCVKIYVYVVLVRTYVCTTTDLENDN